MYKTFFYMGVKLGFVPRGITQIEGIDDMVLRRIFGPKGEDITGGWRKQCKEGLHNKQIAYCYCDQTKKIK